MREKCSMESDRVFIPFHMIDHARSLRQVANHLDEGMNAKVDGTLFKGKILAVAVLMTLAVEIALKALQCQEDKEDIDRKHDLLELFRGVNEDTQARLKVRVPTILGPVSLKLGIQNINPVGAGIEKVLEYHQSTFTELKSSINSGINHCNWWFSKWVIKT